MILFHKSLQDSYIGDKISPYRPTWVAKLGTMNKFFFENLMVWRRAFPSILFGHTMD